ncbi:MAG: LamG-like jellyroll fold domain-containing protein [Bacteroidota bacterium]
MRLVLSCFLSLLACSLFAQTDIGLVAHYTFEGDFTDQTGDSSNGGVSSGVPEFGCGVIGQAVQLFGGNDFIRIPGAVSNNINREFDTEDISLSLYFKSVGFNGTQYLISKRDTNCAFQNLFYIRLQPQQQLLTAYLREGNQEVRIEHRIQNTYCWQQVALVRDNRRVRLYLNGEQVGEQGTTSRVDIFNTGELTIGSSNCLGLGETAFDGLIDEVRIYNRALDNQEVEALYDFPDRILTTTDRIFLGESLQMDVNSPCGVAFEWVPADGISDPTILEPEISPTTAGRQGYEIRITDAESSCVARDTFNLLVIDPTTLDCGRILLPSAFTPNGIGPEENETFGISNPFAIAELLGFEIYDRWGGIIFSTADPFARWDGRARNEDVSPGVYLWKVVAMCEGQEIVQSGSVTVLR